MIQKFIMLLLAAGITLSAAASGTAPAGQESETPPARESRTAKKRTVREKQTEPNVNEITAGHEETYFVEPEPAPTETEEETVLAVPDWEDMLWDYSPETLDSLLNCLHTNNTVASFDEFFNDFIQIDTTVVLTSEIPDSIYRSRLRAILSPIGLPWNDIVKQFIISYTTKRRTTMSNVLSRSQYYFPIIEEELARAGLPLELRMLPVVESALSPTARSRMGAMGLWQFMYGTGKSYGLEITSFIDQRCNPEASTKAACRYLRDLYGMYGDWTLALAAYNCGPGNVNKAFKRAGEKARTYWDIYPYLPSETRNYVPSFIAATYAYAYHRQHDIDICENVMPLAVDTVIINRLTHFEQVASTLEVPCEMLRMLNPQYLKDIVPALTKPYPLVLPQKDIARFIDRQEEIYRKDSLYLAEYINPANLDKTKQALAAAAATTHRVKNGENLGTIARKYGVTVNQIIRWNNLKNPNKLKIGQRLEIRK